MTGGVAQGTLLAETTAESFSEATPKLEEEIIPSSRKDVRGGRDREQGVTGRLSVSVRVHGRVSVLQVHSPWICVSCACSRTPSLASLYVRRNSFLRIDPRTSWKSGKTAG